MPVHLHSIDGIPFLSMEGNIYRRQERIEVVERAGVDGSGIRWLGKGGQPFELVTTNYVADFATAKANMDFYAGFVVGRGPLTVYKNSVNEGTFIVLGVVQTECYAIFNSIGGFDGNEEVCQVVTWRLLG